MSHDEIVFDDVQYREPERRRRPEHDGGWACLAYEIPKADDLPIYLERGTADVIERHALRDTRVELGGILLGKECVDETSGRPFVLIVKSLEAKHYENTQASFTYTHDSWEEITRERDRLHPDLDIVGWYHTHPDFGIFLSGHDLFIHRHFFSQPLQVAYVVDPIRQTRGFFRWRDGGLDQVGGFHIVSERADRVALARLVNDLENVPNPDGGGSLSPRLEAELIAMLTRPQSSHLSATDRTQTAAIFSLAGGLAGMLMFAILLWLFSMNNQLQDQTQAIKDLNTKALETSSKQSLALDALLGQSTGTSAEKILRQYEQVIRERDQSSREVDRWRTIDAALNDRSRALFGENLKLKEELGKSKVVVEAYNAAKKDYPDLQTRLSKINRDSETQEAEIARLKRLLDTVEGHQAEELVRRYDLAWYVAAGGWGVAVLLVLGLLTLLGRIKGEDAPDQAPPPLGTPTHKIV
ncbi:Mov34/MPN/PAD-1 family protein [Singulisphaera rosea]